MKKIIVATLAAVLLMANFVQPAAAKKTKYKLHVINYTNHNIVITLTDTEQNSDGTYDTYEMKIWREDEKTSEFPKGTYTYEYLLCGVTKTGTLELKGDKEWEFLPCGIAETKMRFASHFADPVTVTLYGPLEMPEPEEQTFKVELGNNPLRNILSGHYIISWKAHCSTVAVDPDTVFSEEVRVLKNGTTVVMMHGCEWYAHPARTYAKPVPVKFQIFNRASFPIILQIIGPQGELLTINPGVNTFSLIYGTYKYGYFLDNEYHTGYMMVTKNGQGRLVLTPSHIYELPGAGGEDNGG